MHFNTRTNYLTERNATNIIAKLEAAMFGLKG